MQILWIDDMRKPPIQFGFCDWATTYADALFFLKNRKYDLVCFDHDLGEKHSGYDVAKWMVEHNYPVCAFHIHSMNPIGTMNMRQLLTHYGYKEI